MRKLFSFVWTVSFFAFSAASGFAIEPIDITGAPSQRKIALPVSWQLTLAQFKNRSVATLSESYEELWSVETYADGRYFLVSPRARVPIYPNHPSSVGFKASTGPNVLPLKLFIEEIAFAKLLGLGMGNGAATEPEGRETPPTPKWVSIDLKMAAQSGENITLVLSDEAHYDLHFRFSNGISTPN